MATVDIDMCCPIDEIEEPIHIRLSIEELRYFLSRGYFPQITIAELQDFIEEYDAHGN